NLGFSENAAPGAVGEITTGVTPTVTETALLAAGVPSGISPGPAGSNTSWFTEFTAGKVGSITAAATPTVAEYPTGTTTAAPTDITVGPDGRMWFTEQGAPSFIGRADANGANVTETAVTTTANTKHGHIAVGPDGNIWFTEQNTATGGGKVARLLVQPTVSITPDPVTFSTAIGTTGTMTVTATATGGGAATVTAVSVTPTASFGVTNNCSVLTPTSPSCTMSVTFSPTSAGTVTGTLTVTDTSSNSPHTVALSGTPLVVNTGVSPLVTNFFNQAPGTTT